MAMNAVCMGIDMMEIVFEGPWFSSQEDEDNFFEKLYKLPQYSNVVGRRTQLYLELKLPLEKETVLGLLQVFHQWKIETNTLVGLKSILPDSEF